MRARGFSYLEVIIAIGLIGSMLALFHAVLTGSFLSALARHEGIARAAGETKLEALRASGYDALPASGAFTSGAVAELPSGSGALTVSSYDASTKLVQVAVSWVEPQGSAHSFSLDTLVAKTGGLP